MLQASFGTDLESAFGLPNERTPIQQQMRQPVQVQQAQQQPTVKAFDTNTFNKQFDMYQSALQQQKQLANSVLQQNQQIVKTVAAPVDPSYVDKMMSKKRDVLKLIVMSMVIIVALGIHTCTDFWLKDIVAAYELTYKQELGLRVLYPVLAIGIIWYIKVMISK